jgi:hypothetical protein
MKEERDRIAVGENWNLPPPLTAVQPFGGQGSFFFFVFFFFWCLYL